MPKLQIYLNPGKRRLSIYLRQARTGGLLHTTVTRSLDQQVNFIVPVTFGKLDRRNLDVQATGLPASDTFEMHMVVMVAGGRTSVIAKGIFKAAFVIQDLMDQTFVEKRFERPVHGYAVKLVFDLFFDVPMGKRMILPEKQVEYLLPARRGAEPECFQQSRSGSMHDLVQL